MRNSKTNNDTIPAHKRTYTGTHGRTCNAVCAGGTGNIT